MEASDVEVLAQGTTFTHLCEEIAHVGKMSSEISDLERAIEEMRAKQHAMVQEMENNRKALEGRAADALEDAEGKLTRVEPSAKELVTSGEIDGLLKKRETLKSEIDEYEKRTQEARTKLAEVEARLQPVMEANKLKRVRTELKEFLQQYNETGESAAATVEARQVKKPRKNKKRDRVLDPQSAT